MDFCSRCGERAVLFDPDIGRRICSSCGVEHDTDIFQNQEFTSDGRPTGTLIQSTDSVYRDNKIYRAKEIIADITNRIGLSPARVADVTRMVSEITDGEFGMGEWFPVLVAACSYVTMRQNRVPLSIAEVAAAVGHEVYDVGKMVSRVSQHFDIGQLPELNVGNMLERAMKTCPCLSEIEKDRAEEMTKQGKFLLQCAVNWFLTTGRQPLPLVAAVIAFVSEVNGVAVNVEEIAKDLLAGVATSKLRKKELAETLVKAARVLLPWGEDVNVRNIVHNAPLLLRFMEIKSKSGSFGEGSFRAVLHDEYLDAEENDSIYFTAGVGQGTGCKDLKLSGKGLSSAYEKALEDCKLIKTSEKFRVNNQRKRKRGGFTIDAQMSCMPGKNLSLEEVLKRDVGYNPPPPSFLSGLEARKKRKEKIQAAKIRISQVVNPNSHAFLDERKKDSAVLKKQMGRSRKGEREGHIDWEDCIIELLLLHRISEEEIEQGQYRRLLDLHIFNSLNTMQAV